MPPASLPFARLRGTLAAALLLLVSPLALSAAAPDGGPSATDLLSKAEAQARAEHKNILLDFDASWCGNCRLYDRFRADPEIHTILSRAFVFVTLVTGEREDDPKHANTPGGVAFESRIGGKGEGFPWLTMLSPEGRLIVSSDRPDPKAMTGKSNIGYPDSPEEIDWFVEMLRKSAPQLSPEDLSAVHTWLTAHSRSHRH